MKLSFKEYQKRTLDTLVIDETKDKDLLIARLALGVAGEGGEVAEKVKKFLRGDYEGDNEQGLLTEALIKEIGDVLFYCATLAHIMGLDLGEIASDNIAKLKDRKKRNKIKGSGDNR